jgi:hypothetical protein
MNFSLAVPFTELFFGLARRGTEPAEIADPVTREHQGVLFVDAA